MKIYTLEQANELVFSYYKDQKRTMPFPKDFNALNPTEKERVWVLAETGSTEVSFSKEGVVYVQYN